MKYSFHSEAEAEFHLAIDYYEGCQQNLGYDFAVEVLQGVRNIMDYPRVWPVLEGDIRRYLISRFPYGIVYSHEGDEILILAVMHLHRAASYWKHRAQPSKKRGTARRRGPRRT